MIHAVSQKYADSYVIQSVKGGVSLWKVQKEAAMSYINLLKSKIFMYQHV
jgi:hypothetical protein